MELIKLVISALLSGLLVQLLNMYHNRKKRKFSNLKEEADTELVWKKSHDILSKAYLEAMQKIIDLEQKTSVIEIELLKHEAKDNNSDEQNPK